MLTDSCQSKFFILGFFLTVIMLNTGCSDGGLPGLSESLDETVSPIEVVYTFPEYADENIDLDVSIQATFSASIDTGSINHSTFVVREGGIEISGTFSYSDSTVTFMPNRTLARNTSINTTITSQVADAEGNTMDQDYEWNFTTRPPTTYEATPPSIIGTNPNDGATDISFSTNTSAQFSKILNPETINSNTFYLQNNNGNIISGSVSYTDSTATFTPSGSLREGTEYTATITNDIEDPFGNSPNQSYNWNFTTKEIDRTPPHITSTKPQDDEDDAPVDVRITATFSEQMDASTINEDTFEVYLWRWGLFRKLSGSITYSGTKAAFTPQNDLRDEQYYVVTISSDVTDLSGNALSTSYRWDFETEDD